MRTKRILALLLAVVMAAAFAACAPAKPADTVLVVGVDAMFEEKWNPFLVESAYDHQSVDQVFAPVCYLDANNELQPYAGEVKAEETDDGGVLYTVTIKKNMKFSDGKPVTIDDYIYGIMVRADPSYTGPGTVLGTKIEGVEEYYYDDPNYSENIAAIEEECKEKYSGDNITWEDFLVYAEGTALDGWWTGDPAGDVGDGETTWSQYIEDEGFGDELAAIDATDPDQMFELLAKVEYENYGPYYDPVEWYTNKSKKDYALNNLSGGADVTEISGIKKVNDYSCTIKYTEIDIYADRGLTVKNGMGNLIPKHYYGDFTKGDVSAILANKEPMGSGPYIWGGFADNIVTCTANVNFFLGVPKTGTVRWQYIPQNDILPSLESGTIDIANPNGSKPNVEILEASTALEYHMIDNAGYGYMGMNTERVPLDVRRGLWSLMNRQPSVEGWYGPVLAKVIERPMTTTLAEYPQDAAQVYPYSRDEALKFFNAAGYTQKDGKLVDASGNQLVFNCYISGNGNGEHPAYSMLSQAAEDLKALGGEIQIQDVDFNVLQGAMNDGTADAWIMAWSAVYDCDKREQFRSTGGQNRYRYADDHMDEMLDKIIVTIDLTERRKLVAEMLDYAMDQCIEYPLYQRKNIIAYNATNVNMSTVPQATTFYDYEQELWKVEINQNG